MSKKNVLSSAPTNQPLYGLLAMARLLRTNGPINSIFNSNETAIWMGNWQDSFPARLEIGYKGEAAAKMRSAREQMKLRSYGVAYNSDARRRRRRRKIKNPSCCDRQKTGNVTFPAVIPNRWQWFREISVVLVCGSWIELAGKRN